MTPNRAAKRGCWLLTISVLSVFVGIPFLALSIFGVKVLYTQITGMPVHSWPTTEGTVIEGTVYTETFQREGQARIAASHSSKLRFRFRYFVNDKEYIGTRYSPAGNEISDDADVFLNSIKLGMKRQIHYLEENPEESYFTTDYSPSIWVWLHALLPVFVLFSLIGVIARVILLRKGRRTKKEIYPDLDLEQDEK